MDGSSAPPLKFDQVEYQTSFDPPKPQKASDNRRRRRRWLTILAAVVLTAGVGFGGYWYLVGRFYETTNDAYLGADSVAIAPKVAGYVVKLAVNADLLASLVNADPCVQHSPFRHPNLFPE